MGAVDEELGSPQRYFEVTANAQNVRLFVNLEDADGDAGRSGDRVQSYVYLDGEVVASGEPQQAEGFTFEAADVDFEPSAMLDAIADEAPDATVEEFSIVGTQTGPPRYAAFARSARGGLLDVVLSAQGEVLEVDPAS